MRIRLTTIVFGLFFLIGAAASTAAPAGKPACVNNAPGKPGCVARPHKLGIDDTGKLVGLKWQRFGGADAVAYGTLRTTAISGDPTAGAQTVPAKARFYTPITCGNRKRYTRLRVTYGNGYGKIYTPNLLWFAC